MATLYITEFSGIYAKSDQTGQMAICPPVAQQTVTVGSEAKSAAFNVATNLIRVHTDAICSIAIGTSPTATTAMMRLAVSQTEYFAVSAGDKLSCISNS
jgi:actin-like ATPase involved in cell morphogenesis